ncbi:MAG: hypothetical protein UY81_C0038G0004 [Candidatus Giovannonibacteria bacterium GW2011_GWA2_53_7]|uniref:Uncharacterized protein n=1 Tax=Candidatus Giovannonibacteria bacterium GW2011_GWA2_53_7 TaxID=1618650 RepID=A0A0G2ASA8_9BACT|nr:MAG: hypothetical protein UY81_C0038G0004 [Candidatus Giovannonibacteria bacterium GW2011_GWA2_53_7]HBY73939.1 hypothetical protein [Candidatus Kerfeldbacteria bacterium]
MIDESTSHRTALLLLDSLLARTLGVVQTPSVLVVADHPDDLVGLDRHVGLGPQHPADHSQNQDEQGHDDPHRPEIPLGRPPTEVHVSHATGRGRPSQMQRPHVQLQREHTNITREADDHGCDTLLDFLQKSTRAIISL